MLKEQPPQSENPSWTPEEIKKGEELARQTFEGFWERNWRIFQYRMQEGYEGLKIEQSPLGTWAIDVEKENPTIYFEPSYFLEEGFAPEQATFATFHEIGHWRDKLQRPDIWLEEVKKWKGCKRRKLLVNSLADVWDNTEVLQDFGSLRPSVERLYKEKLFPERDLTQAPRHIQFADAMLLERMLTSEEFKFSPEVEQALEKITKFKTKSRAVNLLSLIANPDLSQEKKFEIIDKIIEPIYEELFEKDVEEQKSKKKGEKGEGGEPDKQNGQATEQGEESESQKEKEKGESKDKKEEKEKGEKRDSESKKGESEKEESEQEQAEEGEQEPQNPEDYFKKDYEEAEKKMIPQPIKPADEEEILKKHQQIEETRKREDEQLKKKIEEEAERLGLAFEIVQEYYQEKREIEPLIREMLRVVSKIVVERRKNKRRLVGPTKEGVLVDPVRAHIDFSSGKEETYAFRRIETAPKITKFVGAYDLYLVCDLSSSMIEGNAEKLRAQRKSVLLMLETMLKLDDEMKRLIKNGDINQEDDLAVRTELRHFSGTGDIKIKSLDQVLTHDRIVKIYSAVSQAQGGTPDFLSLNNINKEILPEELKMLEDKKKRKLILVFSDGESNEPDKLRLALNKLRQIKSLKVVGLGMDQSAYAIAENYQPDGIAVPDVKKLPDTLKTVLRNELDLLAEPIKISK